MSLNSVNLVGNIGRDPELRTTGSGTNILSFSLAVNDRTRDANGEWTEYTNWIDIIVFGERGKALSRHLAKGMRIAVNGRLHYSSWEKDGQKRSKIEVIANDIDFMQRKEDGGGNKATPTYSTPKKQQSRPPADAYDEDIPF